MEENAESLHIPPWKVIAFLSSDVYVCNILSFCCCVCTQLRGDLYARGAIENCLLRDAALMSSLHVSQKPLRRRRGGRLETGGLCCVTGITVTRPAQLFNHRLSASSERHTRRSVQQGSWDEV